MARLVIRRVKYEGRNYSYESPELADGLNILVGANGTGKSTFSNLIYFGLGGEVEYFRSDKRNIHQEVVGDSNNYVRLTIEIDGSTYTLTRYIGSNEVGVVEGDSVTVLPINRTKDIKVIFSDWLLQKLGIEPVELQFGTRTWQVNIRDLMRLIYHDQSPDPSGIYKAPDHETNFINDSAVMREAIFELLLGKSFQEYYKSLAKFRELEKRKLQQSATLEIFKNTIKQIQEGREDLNSVFIKQQLKQAQERLEKLLSYRKQLARSGVQESSGRGLASKKQELLAAELKQVELIGQENDLVAEIDRLEKVHESLVLETHQIRKMVYAHEQLGLFSANTCPYCLREVKREPHRCVCGASVDEKDYERFFYEAGEYLTILRTKQKNIETLDVAIGGCITELDAIRAEKARSQSKSDEIRESISQEVADIGMAVDLAKFEDIDNSIVKLRDEIAALERQLELEMKREKLEGGLAKTKQALDSERIRSTRLEQQAEEEMQELRRAFSEKYTQLMRETVKACRQAVIDSSYMPLINGGEYREASASVPMRLMYYLTMLHLSKMDKAIRFPRFLLIDTPDTAGIDLQNLINDLRKVASVAESDGEPCQVILTTGENKYPPENEEDVLEWLSEEKRLLKRKDHGPDDSAKVT